MTIYVLNACLTIFWGILLLPGANKKRKKTFIFLVSVNMILLSGLRDQSIGADTWNYANHFKELINPELDYLYGWKPLIHNFIGFGNSYNSRDAGFELFTKLFATIIPNFRIFLFVVAIFVCVGMGKFFYRYSSDLCMSYLMFEAFLLDFMLLTGIRQTIAIGLVVFWGYDLIKQKKLIKFLILCLVAMQFHASAVIAVPFYFICNYKKRIRGKYGIVLALTAVIYFFKSAFFRILPLWIYADYAKTSGITAFTFVAFMIAVVIIIAFMEKTHLLKNNDINDINLIDGTLIAELCTTSSVILSIFFRMSFYYQFYMYCYIPKLFSCFERKQREWIKVAFYIAVVLYIYARQNDYAFFF